MSWERPFLWGLVAFSFTFMFLFVGVRSKPWLEVYFPINEFFATIQSIIWYILIIVFFGALAGLAKGKEKQAVIVLNVCFALAVSYKLRYLFKEPWIYSSTNHARTEVCKQSSFFSSGPAAAVNYLSLSQVYITEGEAAKGAKMQPRFGSTLLQATWLINESFRKRGINKVLKMEYLDESQLTQSREPFLAVVKVYGLNHIVCVEEVKEGYVHIRDSRYGKMKKSLDAFLKLQSGVIAI